MPGPFWFYKCHRYLPQEFIAMVMEGGNLFCIFYEIHTTYSGLKGIPGGPSKSTARGLFDSNLHRVPRAISSYTSGLCRANRIVSSISLQNQKLTIWIQKNSYAKNHVYVYCTNVYKQEEHIKHKNMFKAEKIRTFKFTPHTT